MKLKACTGELPAYDLADTLQWMLDAAAPNIGIASE
jgi:uncharacterized protein YijF (DUF1287 family)